MLVLTRQPGEQIVIDGKVRLTVVAVRGDRVRIGVTAPPSIPVNRKEVHDRLAEQAAETPMEPTPRRPVPERG